MSLLSLPVELILNILEYTDYRTAIACRKSCRRLKDIADATPILIYAKELVAAGMCDGAPNGVSTTERLRRLRSSQSSWESPSPTWSQSDNFPYSKQIFSFPLAVSGNLAIFCDTPLRERGIAMLLLLRFPSDLRGIPGRQWYLNFKSKKIERICADDSQDLLIFFSVPNIHIRTLSTGRIHPLTNTPGYINPGMHYRGWPDFYFHIYNDLVAFVRSVVDPHILVFNWKTGEQILKIPCFGHFSGCTFLDASNVIFPYRTNGDEQVARLRVVTLPSTANSTPLRFYDFALGSLSFRGLSHYRCVNTLPSNPSGSCFPGLFHVDPRSKILVFQTNDRAVMGSPRLSMLHVPHDTFLSYIATHPAESDTVVVPWVEWGPGNSHLSEAPNALLHGYSRETTCGMYALTEPPMIRSPGERKTLRIKDYHPQRVARILSKQDLRLPGPVNIKREGSDHFDIAAGSGTSLPAGIPYATMDIPLPDEIQSDCVNFIVGEDVVVFFEMDEDAPGRSRGHVKRVLYHPI